ncbi:MAG TPA: hypothetical protein PKO06_22995, partial [Candidatus Ozemobacteraceae bacterium]|nr:hypothetical protein [Candidatus Ozemobacteraceae bacterium]
MPTFLHSIASRGGILRLFLVIALTPLLLATIGMAATPDDSRVKPHPATRAAAENSAAHGSPSAHIGAPRWDLTSFFPSFSDPSRL